jgi:hypothetical protein
MKRGGWLRRRTPLRPVSAKRAVLLSERREVLAGLADTHRATLCLAHQLVPSVDCGGQLDPHEPLTRARGGSITDDGNIVFLCRRHHRWAHNHPVDARRLGLLVNSWDRP